MAIKFLKVIDKDDLDDDRVTSCQEFFENFRKQGQKRKSSRVASPDAKKRSWMR
eukprot:COSAG02_NODE_2628_length_8394_cov_3.247016_1_plen_54_part_00